MVPTVTQQIELRFGGFWRRFWAYFIDVYAALGVLTPLVYLGFATTREIAIPASLLGGLLSPGYFIFTHYRWGQSIGKAILGLKVASNVGGPFSFQQAISRYLVDLIIAVTTSIVFVSALVEIPATTYLGMKIPDRILLATGRQFLLLMGFGWLWLAANGLVLFLNKRKRTLRDFLASSCIVLVGDNTSGYPKRKIVTLLILPAMGNGLLQGAVRSSRETAMVFGALGVVC